MIVSIPSHERELVIPGVISIHKLEAQTLLTPIGSGQLPGTAVRNIAHCSTREAESTQVAHVHSFVSFASTSIPVIPKLPSHPRRMIA